ncbi:MAG: MlaD family protein [Luteolibacter sp.]
MILLSLVGFVVWKQEWFRKKTSYYLLTNTSEGFNKGMSVRNSGFRIGTVDEIELLGSGKVRIDISVFTEYSKYLRELSKAKVRGENLIGDRFIDIQLPADAEISPQLSPGSRITFVRSKSIEAFVDELEAKFSPIINNLGALSESLPETAKKIDVTINEANGLITDLRSEEGDLMSGLSNFNLAIDEIRKLTITLRSDDGSLMSGIANLDDTANTLKEKIGPLTDEMTASAESIRLAAEEAKTLITNANSVVTELGDVVQESSPEIPGLVHDGAQAAGKADEVIDSVRNMWPIRRGKKDLGEDLLKTGSDD